MLSPSVDGAPWAGVASVPWDGAPADSIGMSTSGGLKCATSDVRTHFRILSGAAGSFPSADSCCSAPGRARTDGTTHSRRQQLHYQLLSFFVTCTYATGAWIVRRNSFSGPYPPNRPPTRDMLLSDACAKTRVPLHRPARLNSKCTPLSAQARRSRQWRPRPQDGWAARKCHSLARRVPRLLPSVP